MRQPRLATGIGITLLGIVLLLDTLAIIDLWALADGWWPLLLVVAGVVLLLRRTPAQQPALTGSATAVLAQRSARVEARPYRGGRAVAVLGSAQVDLRDASLDGQGATLRVVAVLGDVEIVVPAGWRVHTDTAMVLGDLTEDVLAAPDTAPLLSVEGVVVLADVDVRTATVVG